MGVYISSDGTEKDTASMNSFNLVNGLIKSVNQVTVLSTGSGITDELHGIELSRAEQNVKALKEELLTRLDTRPKAE